MTKYFELSYSAAVHLLRRQPRALRRNWLS